MKKYKNLADRITKELDTIMKINSLCPFAALLAGSSLLEYLTFQLFHLSPKAQIYISLKNHQNYYYQKGYWRHIKWRDIIDYLEKNNLLPPKNKILFLLEKTNDCRHAGYRPKEDEIADYIKDIQRSIGYFSSLILTITCASCERKNKLPLKTMFEKSHHGKSAICGKCKRPLIFVYFSKWSKNVTIEETIKKENITA